MLSWIRCFLCDGKGRLFIGKNYNQFYQEKNLQCPFCKGSGQLAIKKFPDNPWNKQRKDYYEEG